MPERTARAVLTMLALPLLAGGCSSDGVRVDDRPTSPAAAISGPDCGEAPAPAAGGTPLTCAFADDFDGTELDTSKWLIQETWYSGMTSGNQDCYSKSEDNVSVSGGAAHITARVVAEPFVCTSPLGSFTSQSTVGTIATKDRFEQAYGRFEFRVRFPETTAPGVHSAAWLYPAEDVYGPWPHSGEVDVAEWFSARPERVHPSVHYAGEDPLQSSGSNCPVAEPWDYHTYAVTWTPTEMVFEYDGVECFRHTWTPAPPLVAPQPFDRPFYIVLTQVFGAEWNAVTEETPDVATMDVDWVRAWA